MAIEITNKLRAPSKIRITSATSSGLLTPNSFSANANLENVTAVSITSVKYSLSNTSFLLIERNSIEVARFFGSGEWTHDELGITNNANGTLVVVLSGLGVALLGIKKEATYTIDTEKL